MSKTKEDCLEIIKQLGFTILGEFVNDIGKEYILFHNIEKPKCIFIAGEETNWDFTKLSEDHSYSARLFKFTEAEKVKINDILT